MSEVGEVSHPDRADGPRLGKRQRQTFEDSMDWSNTTSETQKCGECEYCDGALLCLPLQVEIDDVTSYQLAVELARCLHEPKQNLLKDAVEVLGAHRAVAFFRKTADTQKQGGILTADGDKKRAPGGVFLSLVKSSVTEQERKQIFAKERRLAAKEKQAKEARRRKKWREDQERKKREVHNKAQKQLENFRKELSGGNFEHPPDRNMERRQKNRVQREDSKLEYTDLDHPTKRDDSELSEGWRNDVDDWDDFTMHVGVYKRLRKRSPHAGNVKLGGVGVEMTEEGAGEGLVKSLLPLEEKKAAEQFERTDQCDFGIDLNF